MPNQYKNVSLLFKNVPKNVRMIIAVLQHAGYEAYLVGGCVRDHFTGNTPEDYDITTNANPQEIIALFPRTFYENIYGTVGVVSISEEEAKNIAEENYKKKLQKGQIVSRDTLIDTKKSISQETQNLKDLDFSIFESNNNIQDEEQFIKSEINRVTHESIIEVTPFRLESDYSDGRHPNTVKWSQNIHDDLKRRDFTCNALAYDIIKDIIIDDFDGIKDIKNKILRAVGNSDERFNEDGLRLIRAVRLAGKLNFKIEETTGNSIKKNHTLLKDISHERIRDEFCKILLSKEPKKTIELAHEMNILQYIVPEIETGIGVTQNQAHSFDVWEHNLRTLQHAADKNWSLKLRIAALLHDVSKPETRRFSREKKNYTFYGHDVVGSRVSCEILNRLKFSKEIVEYVSSMIRWHMFFSDTEQITLSAVKRLITNIGPDKIWDLINLRICDRVGTGRPKEEPYRFRKYQSMIEQALTDPISLKQLKINGQKIMSVTQETPGPKIGMILNALFSEVLQDSSKNTEDYLENKALYLKNLNIKDLKQLAKQGLEILEDENKKQISQIRQQFRVK